MGSSNTRRGKSNKKKGWKKVQLQDVDEFLHAERLEKSLGVIDQTNIESLYEITTLPDYANARKKCDFTSYSFNSLKRIAPNSYDTTAQNCVSSDEEPPSSVFRARKENVTTQKGSNDDFAREDIWFNVPNGGISSKRKNKTENTLPSFKIQPPASGLSYHPDFNEYEKYVNSAASFDLIRDKNSVCSENKLAKDLPEAGDQNAFVVAMAGDYHVVNSKDDVEHSSEVVIPIVPNRMKAKSKKEKLRKRLQKKRAELYSRVEAVEKNKRRDVHQLKSINLAVSEDEKSQAERRKMLKRKSKIRAKQELLKKTLPPVSEIPIPEELTGCLRTVTPTISILDNKAHHIRASKLIVKRKKSKRLTTKRLSRKVYRLPNKIMQDLD